MKSGKGRYGSIYSAHATEGNVFAQAKGKKVGLDGCSCTYYARFEHLVDLSGTEASLSTPQLTQVKYAMPGRDAATLTLADGSQVVLDSTKGTITNNNGGADYKYCWIIVLCR
jgi:hypothetical protein